MLLKKHKEQNVDPKALEQWQPLQNIQPKCRFRLILQNAFWLSNQKKKKARKWSFRKMPRVDKINSMSN